MSDFETDFEIALDNAIIEVHKLAVDNGFWDTGLNTPLGRLMLVVTELGEAAEAIRKPHMDEHCPDFTNYEIELADAVIRIMDIAGGENLDLSGAILAKMAYNKTRPFRHGKTC